MSARTDAVHILHVDADTTFLERASTYLERQDDRFEVTTTAQAGVGIDLVTDHEFDCVVSEYDVSGHDGIEFLHRVRGTDEQLPFILFTGEGSERIASEAISAGVTDYLRKGSEAETFRRLADHIDGAVARAREDRAKRQLLDLAESTNCVCYVAERDWSELLYINPAYEELWGRSVEPLSDDPAEFLNGVHPEDRETVRTAMKRLSSGESVDLDYRVNPDEDFRRWVHVRGEPLVDETGAVTRVGGVATDITEHKRRERQFASRRSTLEATLEAIPDGVIVVDDDGEVVTYNDAFADMWDVPERVLEAGDEQRVREAITDAIVPPDEGLARSRRDEDDASSRRRDLIRLSDGRVFERYTAPALADDGTRYGRIWTFSDITSRRERDELQAVQSKLEAANNAAAVGTWEWQIAEDELTANRTFAETFGVDPEKARSGAPVERFVSSIHEEDRERVKAKIREAIDACGAYEAEYRVWNVDDELRWVIARGQVDCDENESPVRFTGVLLDITERKETERELHRHRAFLQESMDIITVVDEAGTIEYQSPAGKRILGYDSEQLVGTDGFELIHPDDRDRAADLFGELIREPDNTMTYECRLRTAGGDWRWLELRATNQLENPAVDGVVINGRDVTERVERERELQQQNERLERFAKVVSHDLRNPLNIARGQLELLREECDADTLEEIERAHERMEQLIGDILSLAREGRSVQDTEPVSLAAVAERGWQNVVTAEATLVTETEATVEAERSRLQRLFENLFRNAIEHAGEDVTITISDLEGRAGFAVADDGPGIPEDERDRVFDPGYSTAENGTGFGLAIIREAAQAHGWDVRVTDSATGGARFDVTGVDVRD